MSDAPRIEAIDRALALLSALAELGPAGGSLATLSESTGVNKSTAYRALTTFRARGYASQTSDGDYRLGPAAIALADRFLGGDNLVAVLHPTLVELSRRAEELVHLGSWADDEVVYLDKVEPGTRAIRVWSAVGQRVPIATSSLGRVLLAARGVPDDQLEVYLHSLPNDRHVTLPHLREQIALTRQRGYSVEHEENEPGVACIGMALMRGDDAVAALSITSLASRMTPERRTELADMIHAELPRLLPDGITLYRGER